MTESAYNSNLKRIEQLLKLVGNDTAVSDTDFIELNRLSDLVAEYEEKHFPVPVPNLTDVIKLRMEERGLSQKDLAELLGVTASRISEYLRGKREVTLNVAKQLHKQLNIDADIILN